MVCDSSLIEAAARRVETWNRRKHRRRVLPVIGPVIGRERPDLGRHVVGGARAGRPQRDR
eukprot:1568249-Lingulodinium_polyedra.AAC.1